MTALAWLIAAGLAWAGISWWRRRSALLPNRSDKVIDLVEVRRLRALQRCVDHHPSGRAS